MSKQSYRSMWLPDLCIIGALFLVAVIVGTFTTLDISLAASFYDAGGTITRWPQRNAPLWLFFYHAIPWFTGALAIAAVVMLIRGTLDPTKRLQRVYGLFIFLTVAFGPGIVVNAVFKDHWGRPRPKHTTQFGGKEAHRPFYLPGRRGKGKSFPCGHSSVGFSFAILALLMRRRKPGLAAGLLVGTFAFGMMVGIGRMAAGAHYFSDVLMSAVMVWAVGWLLYYFVLRIPEREDAPADVAVAAKNPRLMIALYCALGALFLGMLLFATPVHERIRWDVPIAEVSAPIAVDLSLDYGDLHIHFTEDAELAMQLSGEALGFGLPINKVHREREQAGSSYRYHVTHSGVFTERDTSMRIDLRVANFATLKAVVQNGDIKVTGAVPERNYLELTTATGKVKFEHDISESDAD